ncbi:hypothetical protein BDN71DRAFT_1465593 [Pleurotus eryngii]|uniref:Zn(2)-C6 fungal-type domain-containing protein n=1 Tax=Pleurotus eryngii TaxID=5323 RepID=A0A9P6A752_PLEER|nr:hypothetical protein BDN71DRAFT_1465593 [Pleurotus eryngii]
MGVEDTSSTTSPPAPRPKQHRSNTISSASTSTTTTTAATSSTTTSITAASGGPSAGTVRTRNASPSGDTQQDGRPPTKRARKAINCEPCRNSKLKCDRNRPCSSCVLRGTTAMCYQDGSGHDGSNVRGDDHHYARIDPAQEIARLRHSITLLEAHIFPSHRNSHARRQTDYSTNPSFNAYSNTSNSSGPGNSGHVKKEVVDIDVSSKDGSTEPGTLGQTGGLYTGPTSSRIYLKGENRASDDGSRQPSVEDTLASSANSLPPDHDSDLFSQLPPIDVLDSLISYYFDYCSWIYRSINADSFLANWTKYKSGGMADRLTLATASAIVALAVHYLPTGHGLLRACSAVDNGQGSIGLGVGETGEVEVEVVGLHYYQLSGTILHRRLSPRSYTLELIELHLLRANYQTLHKSDAEEIWSILGDLITISKAMGLHRDPGKWRMHRDLAERRRWAWWHIVLLERWQCFMFGRPLFIASHHFDTQMPSYCNPELDKTGRLYLPNVALFRLADILGDIMDDAVSVKPVPYESVLANDRALTQWMENIPPELDLDDYRTARNLASSDPSLRRLGVQSVVIRSSYYHIRFTLHRPYTIASSNVSSTGKTSTPLHSSIDATKTAKSLEIAVGAADKLITVVDQSRPDFLANSSLAVPGHMNWMPSHCFSAAMFFSFQLIANPDQPGAGLFRACIKKAMSMLESSKGMPVANKALDMLTALAPLHEPEFPLLPKEVREEKQSRVLGIVRKLAFPYYDSGSKTRGDGSASESPSGRVLSSPAQSNSMSPPLVVMPGLPHSYENGGMGVSSVRSTSAGGGQNHLAPIYTTQSMNGLASDQMYSATQTHSPHASQMSPMNGHGHGHHPQVYANGHVSGPAYTNGSGHHHSQSHAQHHGQNGQIYTEGGRYAQYVTPVDDPASWGASVGFGQGEWAQFLDGLGPGAGAGMRHLPVT